MSFISLAMASAQKVLSFLLSSSRASLTVLGNAMPNLCVPLKITGVPLSYKRNIVVPLPQNMRYPPIESWFMVNAQDLGIFGCINRVRLLNSLSAKSVLAGEKLVATYSISAQEQYIIFYVKRKLGAPKSTYQHNAQIGEYRTILTSAKKIRF